LLFSFETHGGSIRALSHSEVWSQNGVVVFLRNEEHYSARMH